VPHFNNQKEFQIVLLNHTLHNTKLSKESTGNLNWQSPRDLDKAILSIVTGSVNDDLTSALPKSTRRQAYVSSSHDTYAALTDCLANDRHEEATAWKDDLWGDGHLFDDLFIRWRQGSRSEILVTQYHCLFTRRLIGRRYRRGSRHDNRVSSRFLIRLQCYVSVDVWRVAWRTGRCTGGSVLWRGGCVGRVLALAPTQFSYKTDDDTHDDCCANDPSRNVNHHQDYVLRLTGYSGKRWNNRVKILPTIYY